MGNREIKEMMIKIIDWSSRIIAVVLAILLAIVGSYSMISFPVVIAICAVVTCSFSQLGLFFAPAARHRGIICRVIIAILMLPSSLILYSCVILYGPEMRNYMLNVIIGLVSWRDTIGFVLWSIITTVYTTQYYLLFKQQTEDERKIAIRIIDGMTVIVALCVTSGPILVAMFYVRGVEPDSSSPFQLLYAGIMMGIIGMVFQLGLLLAPLARQKGMRWKIVIAILMPIGIGVLERTVKIISGLFSYLGLYNSTMIHIGYSGILLVCGIYIIQYYLLFKVELGRLNCLRVSLFKKLTRLNA